MANVLTEASSVTCGHEGTVATSGDGRLKVQGSSVLLQAGVTGKMVSGCKTASSNSTSPCASVTSLASGTASKLMIGGQPVLLQGITGVTNGVPPGALSSSAKQSKLSAV
jgi:hypothetical protein